MRRLLLILLILIGGGSIYGYQAEGGEDDIAPAGIIPPIKAKYYAAAFQPGTNRLFLPTSTTQMGIYTISRRPLDPSRELTTVQSQRAQQYVKDLDHPEYATRVAAARRLYIMKDAVAPLLRDAQEQIEPLERRLAATRLLQQFELERQQRMRLRVREVGTLGTFGYVQDMTFSRDGKQLMLGGFNMILVRDLKNGSVIRRFYTDQRFYDVKLLPGGKLIAAAERYQVRVWSITTGRLVRRFKQFNAAVVCCAATPDGGKLIIGGRAKFLYVVSLRTGRVVSKVEGLPGYVNDIAVSPDGKTVAVAGDSGNVSLCDLQTGKLVKNLVFQDLFLKDKKLHAHTYGVEFSPDGRYLVSSGGDGDALLWNLRSEQAKFLSNPFPGDKPAVCFSPDSRLLFTGSRNGPSTIWKIAKPTLDEYLNSYPRD